MARKELNVFGTSFLDLLSGALAAVIILFIIVPKMTAEQQDTLAEIEQLNMQMEELENLMERVRSSVPEEVYAQIQQQMDQLQQTISNLTTQVNALQTELAQARSENEEMRRQIEEMQQRIQNLEAENSRLRQTQQDSRQGQGISDGKVFGMNAELGIVCIWPENVDVDLYVKDLSSGEICYYNHKSTPFGNLNEDITSRASADDDRYELFYQSKIVPGRYQIYVNIYSGASAAAGPAHVEGYAVIFPGRSNQVKIPFRQITLTTPGQDVMVGTLTVTSNNITLQ